MSRYNVPGFLDGVALSVFRIEVLVECRYDGMNPFELVFVNVDIVLISEYARTSCCWLVLLSLLKVGLSDTKLVKLSSQILDEVLGDNDGDLGLYVVAKLS